MPGHLMVDKPGDRIAGVTPEKEDLSDSSIPAMEARLNSVLQRDDQERIKIQMEQSARDERLARQLQEDEAKKAQLLSAKKQEEAAAAAAAAAKVAAAKRAAKAKLAKAKFRIGEEVEVNWKGKGIWYAAKVFQVKEGEVYKVKYTSDNTWDMSVRETWIRKRVKKQRVPQPKSRIRQEVTGGGEVIGKRANVSSAEIESP